MTEDFYADEAAKLRAELAKVTAERDESIAIYRQWVSDKTADTNTVVEALRKADADLKAEVRRTTSGIADWNELRAEVEAIIGPERVAAAESELKVWLLLHGIEGKAARARARRDLIKAGLITPTTTHGLSAYSEGCRCDVCREAHTDQSRKLRRAVGLGQRPPSSHGRTGYDQGCRCQVCTSAKSRSR